MLGSLLPASDLCGLLHGDAGCCILAKHAHAVDQDRNEGKGAKIMKRIWKFPLVRDSGKQDILLPVYSTVIHVGMQDSHLHIWVEVNQDTSMSRRKYFRVIATGEAFTDEDKMLYIGTVHDGPYIWHVYQYKEKKG